LDCALSFTTSGWGPYWTSEAYYGGDCGLSGTITDDQETILETTVQVTSQETVSFWWKVSSEEGCDWLEFYIDDELQDQISGEVDWEQKSYPVSGAGSYTIKWRLPEPS